MPWFKVDDGFHSHPKARDAGLAAVGLWVAAGSFSSHYLTDGWIPKSWVRGWGSNGTRLASKLVSSGLWYEDERDGQRGWSFHEWEQFQPTKDHVESARKRDRIRKESIRVSRMESARNPLYPLPDPTRPDPVVVTSRTKGEGEGDAHDPPPPCPKHPDGPHHDEPCRRCQAVREYNSDETTRAAVRIHQGLVDIIRTRRACPHCDNNGMADTDAGLRRCEHHE